MLSISSLKFLAKPKIKPQVNSVVPAKSISVPHTTIFLFLAAARSIALFLEPLVMIYLDH